MNYQYAVFQTKGGWVGAVFSVNGLYRLTLPCDTERLAKSRLFAGQLPEARPAGQPGLLYKELEKYFTGEKVVFQTPVDWQGYTLFQRQVLAYTASIPYGHAATYGDVARAIGKPRACRAVGQALHINRTPLVVPCHRVLASGGKIGGFGGGVKCKQKLLDAEGITYRT